ncbi:hypothetical protein quinque_014943 [Culex quinquefasciatus]
MLLRSLTLLQTFTCAQRGLNVAALSTQPPTNHPPPATMTSVHSAGIAEVHEMPMSAIVRPIPSELDNAKVESLMATIQDPNQANNAHRRLGRPTITAKLVKSSLADLQHYLGGSCPKSLK